MKEYISKEDVLKILKTSDLGMSERIILLHIATKADIEREFFIKSIGILKGIDRQVADMYIDAILGMENEE